MDSIEGFSGAYRYLSNFWPAEVYFDGEIYPSVEHAYQAAKTLNLEQRRVIREQIMPAHAKRLGRAVDMREDWDDIKDDVMYNLVRQKFTKDEVLRAALLSTGDCYIEETNHWGDTYWGKCNGVGFNTLGHILMRVREELQ